MPQPVARELAKIQEAVQIPSACKRFWIAKFAHQPPILVEHRHQSFLLHGSDRHFALEHCRHGHWRIDGNRAQVPAFLRIHLNIVCRTIGDVNRAVGIHVAIFAELHQDFARRFRLRQCRRWQSESFVHRQQAACFWRVNHQAGRR